VSDAARYHRQLGRLQSRTRGRRFELLVHEGVRFAQILEDRERVVSLLAAAVGDGSYRPAPVTFTTALIGGKARELGRMGALDVIVHGVVAEILAERLEPKLSEHVYSYRRGRSPWQAARFVASRAREHRNARPDPRKRGLYVLRADIVAYTDSIALDADAPIFGEMFATLGLAPSSPHARMLRALIAPRDKGLVFGAPTTNVLGNLHAMPIDAALEEIDGGTYVRFGDDILFAHEDPTRVREARATLQRELDELGLEVNEKKLRMLYWNGAARPSTAWPEAQGTTDVPFLGTAIRSDGTIRLPPRRWSLMLHALRRRLVRTARLVREETPDVRARLLAQIAGDALDPSSPLALTQAVALLDLVDDRTQLRELDYLIARWIAEESTGKRGPRAFREIDPRWLRREAGLASRVVERNRR
jgi:hypothetical protein